MSEEIPRAQRERYQIEVRGEQGVR